MPSERYLITVKILAIVGSSVIAASSCSRRVENGYRTIAYVNSSDGFPSELRTLAESNGNLGDDSLVGDPPGCLRLSERMMICDDFDNIDARKISDGSRLCGDNRSILNFADTAYMNRPATKDGQTVLRS
ncbi:MAG: hypothetical protein ACLVGR_10135 [Anaerovoracaceae bacterium]